MLFLLLGTVAYTGFPAAFIVHKPYLYSPTRYLFTVLCVRMQTPMTVVNVEPLDTRQVHPFAKIQSWNSNCLLESTGLGGHDGVKFDQARRFLEVLGVEQVEEKNKRATTKIWEIRRANVHAWIETNDREYLTTQKESE